MATKQVAPLSISYLRASAMLLLQTRELEITAVEWLPMTELPIFSKISPLVQSWNEETQTQTARKLNMKDTFYFKLKCQNCHSMRIFLQLASICK
jgi:hypothetical protein